MTTIVRGDVGSVRAAVDAGSEAAGRVGELVVIVVVLAVVIVLAAR